jgi:hypothetical protein
MRTIEYSGNDVRGLFSRQDVAKALIEFEDSVGTPSLIIAFDPYHFEASYVI